MSYEPLHHKYRPQTFADLVGQETIANTLTNALAQSKIAPAYLFTGPRGTGKTSSARILAKSLNCLKSSQPTPHPCGQCEACLAIAKGTALDVIEIDAASNTGVDNIREIIDRSRFAPVQCRYKVYAIDECLTGDSLIQTSEGLMSIDNPKLKGKKVLSYNENTEVWEYKKVLRWLERGTKETVVIKTSNRQIRCTGNHLIRTETGWIEAKNVKEGMRILSPVNVDVEKASTNMAWMKVMKSVIIERKISLILPNKWTTNLEKVESVHHAGKEKVYDLEVEDNHNFVANGLLVHNCHMLSTAAFNALLKTLEEPPPKVVFILATTDPQRVLSTIISRCQRFDYRRIPLKAMVSHLQYIAQAEKIAITEEAITLVAQLANGGLRDAESLLDQLSLLPEQITVEKVWDLVGAVSEQDLLALLKAIASDRPELVLQTCRNLLDRGREPLVVLQNLASFYLNLAIAKTAPGLTNLVAVTEACWQELCTEATHWELPVILWGQQQLKEAETQLKNTTQPRLWLEVTLLSLLPGLNRESATTSTPSPPPVVTPQPSKGLVQTTVKQVKSSPSEQSTSQPETTAAPAEEAEVKANLAQPIQATNPEKLSTKPPVVESTATAPSVDTSDTPQVERSAEKSFTKPHSAAPSIDTAQVERSATVNQQPTEDPVANQQLWEQVIACLYPPTTKALLSQHCHLISFNGSSAVVGISSANLQKLHQRKVPNIEAAFAKVCQHKIKVSLEVATPQGQETQKRLPANPPALTSESVAAMPSKAPQSVTLPHTTAGSNNEVDGSEPATDPTQLPPTVIQTTPPADVPIEKPVHLVGEKPGNVNRPNTPNSSLESPHLETKLTSPSEDNKVQDYSPDTLQQAIESLAQSFEGEVVQLEDKVFAEEEEELEIIDIPASTSNITLGNRPDLSNYDDDDDVPF